jgi:hypothetical protein
MGLEMKTESRYPVAVGGIGGSGTRVVAGFLAVNDYYLGDDLNGALDNLWFTLLFKRRSILSESNCKFVNWLSLFLSRMSGSTIISEPDRVRIFRMAEDEQLQSVRNWSIERAFSFCNGRTSKRADQTWCWKEPNTHIVIERIFALQPELRYIHVVRHPVDMAVSGNQRQLQTWGPILFERDVTIEPRMSLSFWCEAHRRIAGFMRRSPERTMMIDFDALCMSPDAHCAQMAEFLGVNLTDDALLRFRGFVRRPESVGRFKNVDLRQFDPADLAYVTEVGYPL